MEDNKLQSQADEQAPRLSALSRRAAAGRAGEEAAAAHLEQLGYRLVVRNWRCPTGEIDLIAEDNTTLVFVEVRSRTNPTRFGSAVEAVTPRKCRQVRELATFYLKQRKGPPTSIRFDVIAVTFLREGIVAEIRHLQGAF
ncbi:YraN family protein [Cohnella sp.]|uniref:YraN family protein n=1 Tax=Cohnella sp. TaxID=1883426 RepID=UPI0035629BBE